MTEPTAKPKPNPKLKRAITAALDSCARDDGWAHLGGMGRYLVTNDPSFDSRNYGYKKLSELMRAQSYLQIREETGPNGAGRLCEAQVEAALVTIGETPADGCCPSGTARDSPVLPFGQAALKPVTMGSRTRARCPSGR